MDDVLPRSIGRKTTLEGLRQRLALEVPRPAQLTRNEFDALDEVAQASYDDERMQWFSNGLMVQTPELRSLVRVGMSLLQRYNPAAVGERGIVLTGPAHVGKTTALVHLAAKTEQWVGKRDPAFKQQGQAPVAYIEMEPKATPKSIASSILNFYGIPHAFRSATQHQLTNLALDALRRHRTRMLIIDELQMLKLDGKSGDDAINSLKTIMNDSGAICVFAGVDLQTGLSSRAAEQIIARCTVIGMRPFSGSTETLRGQWAALIESLGGAMNLLDCEDNHLAPFADLLLSMSNGKIGDLRSVLSLAMSEAIELREEVGQEVVTQDTLLGFSQIGVA